MFLKRNSGTWVKVIFFYVIFSFTADSILLKLNATNINGVNDLSMFNVLSMFTLVEFTVFVLFIYNAIDKVAFRRIIIVSAIAFYAFLVGLYLLQNRGNAFDSLGASVEAILIVVYSMFYLFDQMNKPQVFFIYQEPNFWFVVAFIIYFSGTLFLFIQASNLGPQDLVNYWIINYFLNITKNILFAIAFSTRKSKTLQYSSENPFETYP